MNTRSSRPVHYRSLREHIDLLRGIGELCEVNQEVDWNLEIGAITRRVYETGGPAVLFNKIKDIAPGFRVLGAPAGASALTGPTDGARRDINRPPTHGDRGRDRGSPRSRARSRSDPAATSCERPVQATHCSVMRSISRDCRRPSFINMTVVDSSIPGYDCDPNTGRRLDELDGLTIDAARPGFPSRSGSGRPSISASCLAAWKAVDRPMPFAISLGHASGDPVRGLECLRAMASTRRISSEAIWVN